MIRIGHKHSIGIANVLAFHKHGDKRLYASCADGSLWRIRRTMGLWWAHRVRVTHTKATWCGEVRSNGGVANYHAPNHHAPS